MEGYRNRPYLSIVVAARNDDHGGGFKRRFQIFVRGLLVQCERHRLNAELIIVEWNPPEERPPLSEALNWPEKNDYCPIRIITVPPEVHNRFRYAKKLPLYQFIAKNVGIRRASGEFVLSTCGDLLFSDELIRYLRDGNLKKGFHYRIDRYDVPPDVPSNAPIDEQLRYCYDNTMRVNTRIGTYNLYTKQYYGPYGVPELELPNLHYNACGDFTLMSRDDWYRIKGHPEMDGYSLHIDSLTLLVAYYSGIRQVILEEPIRLYHIEHGFSAVPEQRIDRTLKKRALPSLSKQELRKMAYEMYRTRSPIIINDNNWGMADKEFDETIIHSGRVQRRKSKVEGNTVSLQSKPEIKIHAENTILIINDYPPLYDIRRDDKVLFDLIRTIAGQYRVVYLSRFKFNSERYAEDLMKLGVIFFYDKEGIWEQLPVETRCDMRCPAPVTLSELLEHQEFKSIIFGSADVARRYLHRLWDWIANTRIIVMDVNLSNEKLLADAHKIYQISDMVITNSRGAELLKKLFDEGINLCVVDERHVEDRTIIDYLNNLKPKGSGRKEMDSFFRIDTERGLFPEITIRPESLIFFLYDDDSEKTRSSLDMLFTNTEDKRNPIIVALSNHLKGAVRERLERRLMPYFIYQMENDLAISLSRICSHYDSEYIVVMDSSILVTPDWLPRLLSHLKNDKGVGVVVPQKSNILHTSKYELENDAWQTYKEYKCQHTALKEIDIPCFAFRKSLISGRDIRDIKDIFEESRRLGYKTVRAMDTLVLHAGHGQLRPHKKVGFKRPASRLLSVIVPVLSGKRLDECLESLFSQRGINHGDIEIVLVINDDKEEIKAYIQSLNPPSALKCFYLKDAGKAALLNRGIIESSGRYILLFSEDGVADNSLLYEHIRSHEEAPQKEVVVLGRIVTTIPYRKSPFLRFLSKRPSLAYISQIFYNYDIEEMDKPEGLSSDYFYSPNISMKREMVKDTGLFDGEFSQGLQDMEFGYRLVGLKGGYIKYNGSAVSHLRCEISMDDFLGCQYRSGKETVALFKKHPRPEWDIRRLKRWSLRHLIGREDVIGTAEEIIESLKGLSEESLKGYTFGRTSLLERCYFILSQYHFYRGVDEALKDYEGELWQKEYLEELSLDINLKEENRAEALLLKGSFELGKGNYDVAIEEINTSFGLTVSPFIYYLAGLLYLDSEDFKEAESILEEGIKRYKTYGNDPEISPFILPPGDIALYYIWLAMACIPQGKYEKAIMVLEKAIEERISISLEQGAFLYRCLATCYRKLGMEKKALFCMSEYERLVAEAEDEVSLTGKMETTPSSSQRQREVI